MNFPRAINGYVMSGLGHVTVLYVLEYANLNFAQLINVPNNLLNGLTYLTNPISLANKLGGVIIDRVDPLHTYKKIGLLI